MMIIMVHVTYQLKNSLPKIKGLVIPSETKNLCMKLQGPILKFTTVDPFTSTS